MSISCGPPCTGCRAGIAAAALPGAVVCGCGGAGAGSDFLPSSSRMSAPSPRPSAFLAIGDHLLGKMRVALCPFTVHVIKNNRFAETGRLCQTNVARNHALENLIAKERAQIVGNLARKRCPFVVHGEENPFDLQVRIQRAPRSEEHTSELQSPDHLVCRLLL